MSILIKGMEMPHNCEECGLTSHRPEGLGLCHILHKQCNYDTRPKDCPLVEVPEPHGRLIDADKMVQYLHHQECDSCKTPDSDECFACREPFAEAVTDLQPTVIEAEDDKDS